LWAFRNYFYCGFSGHRGLGSFRHVRFFDRTLSPLDDAHASFYGGFFLRKVFVADLLRELFRNGIGGDADVYAFASHLFNEPLGVEL
jgi:hypothetical protein